MIGLILVGAILALGQIETSTSVRSSPVPSDTAGVAKLDPPGRAQAEPTPLGAVAESKASETVAAADEAKGAAESSVPPAASASISIPGLYQPPTDQTKPADQPPAGPRERRGFPEPFQSPPMPTSEFQGLPLIGVREDTGMQFLMKNLQGTGPGDWLLTHGIKIYGWIDIGGNLSTSRNSNFPVSYDVFPNTVYLDQALLRFQRVMDTAQTDHIEFGFKFDNLYGIDYRYTTSKGFFSEQLLKHNREEGYDPVQIYGEMYIPWIAEGFELRLGRYVSPPDIEAELALENYLHTHSLLYAYDPYTQCGALATMRLSKQWNVQAGVSTTNDMAPWITGARLQGFLGARWVSQSNTDSVYGCFNSFNDGRYRGNHDDLQDLVATWTHKVNSRVQTMTEMWYMWTLNAEVGGTENDGPFKYWGGAAGGGATAIIPGVSNETAILNYTEITLGKWDYLSVRNEFFCDFKGQRTGYQTQYSTHTIGWCHYIRQTPDLQFRPEISYDRAYNARAFDAGARKNQFLLAADLLIRF
jgi:hypothetical protein